MRLIYYTGTRPQNLKGQLIVGILKSLGHPWIIFDSQQHYEEGLAQKITPMAPWIHLLLSQDDIMIVEGDTNTTLDGALWAQKNKVRLMHIEAGCRVELDMPEQHIRTIVDHLSDFRYCVSERERTNCLKEGCNPLKTKVTGDLTWAMFQRVVPEPVQVLPHSILVTMHRHDVTPQKVRMILNTLRNYGHPIFPAHPRVYPWIKAEVGVISAVSYPVLRGYLEACEVVATDSGGLVRESFMAGKPCVILRTATEWTQLVELGRHRIVGTDVRTLAKAMEDPWPERSVTPSKIFGEDPVGQLTQAMKEDLS